MRTTLDLPPKLIAEAQRILGVGSKSDAVVLSLTEIVRRKRLEELKAMRGKIRLHIDVAASRRRPGRPAVTKSAAKRRSSR
jgi:Arc/MetJ family transcription regulator